MTRTATRLGAWLAVGLATSCAPAPESQPAAVTATVSSATSTGATPAASIVAPTDVVAIQAARKRSVVKSDEQVQLFPAYAARTGTTWKLELSGWIYEPERGDVLRNVALGKLKATLGVPAAGAEATIFDGRARPFVADNESGKAIAVSVAGRVFELGASEGDGHFSGKLELDDSLVRAHAHDGLLAAQVLLPLRDARTMATHVRLVEPTGLTIVSDIDDTVKITEVRNQRQMLRRTFLLPFEAVPGMAPKYRAWLGASGHLHFVSSSPWQLSAPLFELMGAAGFPEATYAMKRVRPREIMETLDTLLADPLTTKPRAIREILDRFPERRLVLVGDSGEQDPEVYAPILRESPDRIVRVYIRDVTGEKRDAPRYTALFAGLAPDRWVVFTDASELPESP